MQAVCPTNLVTALCDWTWRQNLWALSTASGEKTLLDAKKTLLDDTKITVATEKWGDAFTYVIGVKTKVFDIMGRDLITICPIPFTIKVKKTEIFNTANTKINKFSTGVNYTNKQINPYSNSGN